MTMKWCFQAASVAVLAGTLSPAVARGEWELGLDAQPALVAAGRPIERTLGLAARLHVGTRTPSGGSGAALCFFGTVLVLGPPGAEGLDGLGLLGWIDRPAPVGLGGGAVHLGLRGGVVVAMRCGGGDDCGPDLEPAMGGDLRVDLDTGALRPYVGLEVLGTLAGIGVTLRPHASFGVFLGMSLGVEAR